MANLYLIPTTLNPDITSSSIIPSQNEQIKHLTHFIVETAKIGRMHLKQLNLNTSLQQLNIFELNKHKQDYSALIKPLVDGHDVGLISDCGCPAIADPGSRVVSIAHEMGFNVVPYVGPSSIILTLMASGLNGQNFSFIGYLPGEPNARKSKLKELELKILRERETFIFIEAPFKNQKTLDSMLQALNGEVKICLGINLMTQNEKIITKTVKAWKNQQLNLDKQEVIFLIGQ
jgi:16S rRNA (cytidine1402-2'-O)-methyltransferase